ncbi:hypothetical protein ACFL96_07320 [Thermoproteota archaeon]
MKYIKTLKIGNKKGFSLVFSYMVVAVLVILAASLYARSISEIVIGEKQKMSTQAFAIAEAGLDRAYYLLRKDFEDDPTAPSWADGDIYNITCSTNTTSYYPLNCGSTSIGEGSYSIELKNVASTDKEIWIKTIGTVNDVSKGIEAYVAIADFAIWNQVLSAGGGAAGGTTINGNVEIRGSVTILGNNLNPGDFAINLSGGALIGNNYDGIPAELGSRIPLCPQVTFNGELVDSLGAELRVKNGKVGLSGTGTAGQPDATPNGYKETLDGVYVSGDYGGNKRQANVYSDNGSGYRYDLGESISFPKFNDPYPGYANYEAYLRDNAFIITDPAQLAELQDIKPNSIFVIEDTVNGKGKITMDGNGNMTIDGIVFIDDSVTGYTGDFIMSAAPSLDTINYTGKGSVVAKGNVNIGVNLYTPLGNNSFPENHIMGVMTPGDIVFDVSQLDVMGLFYAGATIDASKQTDVAGGFAADYFDMGSNVPRIFLVPEVANNLPPGMIGSDTIWMIQLVSWKKL